MQDTKYQKMTPGALAFSLQMDYPALKRAMYRMNITCGKDDMLSEKELAAIIQQQSEPHHKRPEEVIEAAQRLASQIGISLAAASEKEVPPAPAATPQPEEPQKMNGNRPKKPAERKEDSPILSVNQPEPRLAEAAKKADGASPAWHFPLQAVAKTGAVATLLAFQAFIFASLAMQVINNQAGAVHLPFWAAFVAAFLIESGGVAIVSRYKVPEGAGEWAKRDVESSINGWLVPFMLFQGMVDCSYIGLFGAYSHSIGQWLVALAIPGGIFVYSHLYFKR